MLLIVDLLRFPHHRLGRVGDDERAARDRLPHRSRALESRPGELAKTIAPGRDAAVGRPSTSRQSAMRVGARVRAGHDDGEAGPVGLPCHQMAVA